MLTLTVLIVNRIIALLLLLISGYQLWLVLDRWVAAIKYRTHFGADSGPWISLGLDTVVVGFVSLIIVGILTLWARRKARKNRNALSKWVSVAAFVLAAFAAGALLFLVILPITVFR